VAVLADAAHRLLHARAGTLRVKVCCIASEGEAALAVEAGADAIGLVSAMPSGPGVIDDAAIDAVARWAEGRVVTVLLTSRREARGIGEQVTRARPDLVQLCDALAPAELAVLRDSHPTVALVQVVHVRGESSVNEAVRVAPYVDALLLDSGNPDAAVKELGGTGRVHDWVVSRAIRDAVPVPVFLAGGLRAGNVAAAVTTVRPFGVDVCSGVRAHGRLDRNAVIAFVRAARGVDTAAAGHTS
jgi:phosphoribosylanthranilate isomerase